MFSLTVDALELPLVHTFTIARGSESVARTARFRLQWDGGEGLGESSPVARYNESVASIQTYFGEHPPQGDDPYLLDALLDGIQPAARCGLDLALHDAIGKDCGRPLYQLLGLDPSKTPVTSFTVGIDEPEKTLAKVRAIGDHPILKVKLGTGDEIATLEAIRAIYPGTIRIDANEGWDVETSIRILGELARFEIEFCEQPIPAGNPAGLRAIREASPIPIFTDEDSRDASDLAALIGCVDGINVKLVKCGGIRGALAMIHTARALGFKIMLGCMVESAILATAAAHLSPLVDYADIDGPFLTASDPYLGVTYANGKLMLPDGPGLGVNEIAAA